jgi:hypothetical protein
MYDVVPESMHSWGVEGAMSLTHPGNPKSYLLGAPEPPTEGAMLLLSWNPRTRKINVTPFAPLDAVHVSMDRRVQEWQLLAGWHPPVDGYREIEKRATARLYRPPNTDDFAWEACATGPLELRTFIEGQELPKMSFRQAECASGRGKIQPGKAGIHTLDFLVNGDHKAKIRSFGFTTPLPAH